MRKQKMKRREFDNRGSALLTVILVVAFLTILATTLLYVTGMNFMIKQADYQNKKTFYTGETALEEIKAMLMEEIVSTAALEAYKNTVVNYVAEGDEDVRQIEYNKYFTDAVEKKLMDKVPAGMLWSSYLKLGYASDARINSAQLEVTDGVLVDDGSGNLIIPDKAADYTDTSVTAIYKKDEDNGIVTIKGIKMTYINDRGIATIISTDLELFAPEVDWTEAEPTIQRADVSRCVRYTNWKKE